MSMLDSPMTVIFMIPLFWEDKSRKLSREFGFHVFILLFRGFKPMCYGTKQETETSQLPLPCDYFQVVGRTIPFATQLLQGAQDNTHQTDQEKHRAVHHGLRIRSSTGFVPHGKPTGPILRNPLVETQ